MQSNGLKPSQTPFFFSFLNLNCMQTYYFTFLFSLPLSLSLSLSLRVRNVTATSHLLSNLGLHLLFLLPLFVITVLVWAVFVCISMRYCHLNTSLFIVYLNHIFHLYIFFLSPGFGSDFKIIICLFFFFFFSLPPSPTSISSFSSLLRWSMLLLLFYV